ncbi:flavodoxin family protein [Desulfovibrio subterraneus]|uniref:flavodoxin family protein n=1 Tax=Desulfovibrio subterraneus TaxID=2718620 RepID=UPI0022B892C0|nr:flavodoxin family protein [Desulfovibrio subterraneus]WBF66690.1 flavodoxin family protein [Desulfovibrio subterraneus]
MNVIALNGSPRKKNWNTISLLEHALAGAASQGAETELVHLYDLKFSGCISCFACKKLDRKKRCVCAVKDDLTPVLERIASADALILGSPIYYGTETAAMRACFERLCFPYNPYAVDWKCEFGRVIPTALLYTMNISEEMIDSFGYRSHFSLMERTMAMHFGTCEVMLCTDTLQYSDYSKYESAKFDGVAKGKRHEEVFPQDCQRAYELGSRMARPLAG